MKPIRLLSGVLCGIACCALPAVAQSYPDRPIRFVIPFPPGGGADNLGRISGAAVGEALGQQVVIDNKAGAGGNIAAEIVARAAPDGYTVLQGNIAHAIAKSIYKNLSYDVINDFVPVTQLASTPFLLAANASLAATNTKDLIALAKAKPGTLNYASSGNGGPSHLAMEIFKTMTGTDIRHIPYKGAVPAATDLIAGQVQLLFMTVSSGMPYVQSGRLKALGIASLRRSPSAENIPTIAESGVPGFEASTWFGVMLPKGTPQTVVTRLHETFTAALRNRDVQERLLRQGFDLVGSTPQEFGTYVRSEVPKWEKAVKASGATADQ